MTDGQTTTATNNTRFQYRSGCNVPLPEDLHRRCKVQSVLQGRPLYQIVADAVAEYLQSLQVGDTGN